MSAGSTYVAPRNSSFLLYYIHMGDKGNSSLALYRKYRSRTLDEVLGQDHVTGILKRALANGRIAHAYLLTGPRGTGKTSVARILAHEINQLPYTSDVTHLDIIEIDAASNNGVDDIRSLREKARVAPVAAKKKIYIIDEVHMLSKAAFNALLKTLEEPPAHVVFIMATTDADKLPSTILSRVQQYYFHPIGSRIIAEHLMHIAKKEGFDLTEGAAKLIAERSRGGFRDSISLLDQLANLASKSQPLNEEQVAASLGLANQQLIDQLLDAYRAADTSAMLTTLQALEDQGTAPTIIADQLLSAVRSQLADAPQLIRLIAELIEVAGHHHSDLKLLTALISPGKASSVEPSTTPTTKPARAAALKTVSAPVAPDKVEEPQSTYKKPAAPVVSTPPESTKSTGPAPKNFNWQQFLDETKQHSIGLFSLLAKCGNAYADGTLTIYGGTSFTHKKLDNLKNRSIMSEVIARNYNSMVNINITSDKKPPEDEQLAAVAAMMGGGEEVNLEDIS